MSKRAFPVPDINSQLWDIAAKLAEDSGLAAWQAHPEGLAVYWRKAIASDGPIARPIIASVDHIGGLGSLWSKGLVLRPNWSTEVRKYRIRESLQSLPILNPYFGNQ